jgi:hypothetical protein
MTPTNLAASIGVGLAAAVAWQLGGSAGMGVMLGGLCAAVATGLGLAWQRSLLRRSPRLVMGAIAAGFLLKLVVLAAGGLFLRFHEASRARADWQAFALAFVAIAVVVLIPGTFENARALRGSRA